MRNLRSQPLFSHHLAIFALKPLDLGASVLVMRCLVGSFHGLVERNHASVAHSGAMTAALAEEDRAVMLLLCGQLARVQQGYARATPAFQEIVVADRAISEPFKAEVLHKSRREY
jgi:hypothetical protein